MSAVSSDLFSGKFPWQRKKQVTFFQTDGRSEKEFNKASSNEGTAGESFTKYEINAAFGMTLDSANKLLPLFFKTASFSDWCNSVCRRNQRKSEKNIHNWGLILRSIKSEYLAEKYRQATRLLSCNYRLWLNNNWRKRTYINTNCVWTAI